MIPYKIIFHVKTFNNNLVLLQMKFLKKLLHHIIAMMLFRPLPIPPYPGVIPYTVDQKKYNTQ